MPAAKTKPSEKIRETLSAVQVFARTGRLPLVSADEEWVNPRTKKRVDGIVLRFGDNGVCTLDPSKDRDTIDFLNDWLADGTDPRIGDLGVMLVAPDAIAPPFPAWDNTNETKLPQMVVDLGLDVERCLRYELAKDEPRKKLVKFLESKLDEPVVEDADAEPSLD
jgi:hypothetical protein